MQPNMLIMQNNHKWNKETVIETIPLENTSYNRKTYPQSAITLFLNSHFIECSLPKIVPLSIQQNAWVEIEKSQIISFPPVECYSLTSPQKKISVATRELSLTSSRFRGCNKRRRSNYRIFIRARTERPKDIPEKVHRQFCTPIPPKPHIHGISTNNISSMLMAPCKQ